jgi:hypothetical protein
LFFPVDPGAAECADRADRRADRRADWEDRDGDREWEGDCDRDATGDVFIFCASFRDAVAFATTAIARALRLVFALDFPPALVFPFTPFTASPRTLAAAFGGVLVDATERCEGGGDVCLCATLKFDSASTSPR